MPPGLISLRFAVCAASRIPTARVPPRVYFLVKSLLAQEKTSAPHNRPC